MSKTINEFNVCWFNQTGQSVNYINDKGQTEELPNGSTSPSVKQVPVGSNFTALPAVGLVGGEMAYFQAEVTEEGNQFSATVETIAGLNPANTVGPASQGTLTLTLQTADGGLIVGAIDILTDDEVTA